MKRLCLALLTLLAIPQENQCFATEGAAAALGIIASTAAISGVVIVGGAVLGTAYVGKKIYNYTKLTPEACEDAAKKVAALSETPNNHTNEELAKLFDTLNRCQKKFGKN